MHINHPNPCSCDLTHGVTLAELRSGDGPYISAFKSAPADTLPRWAVLLSQVRNPLPLGGGVAALSTSGRTNDGNA